VFVCYVRCARLVAVFVLLLRVCLRFTRLFVVVVTRLRFTFTVAVAIRLPRLFALVTFALYTSFTFTFCYVVVVRFVVAVTGYVYVATFFDYVVGCWRLHVVGVYCTPFGWTFAVCYPDVVVTLPRCSRLRC